MNRILRSPWMLVALAVVTSTGILAARLSVDSLASQEPAVIVQPSTWQPFVAEIVQTHTDGPDLVGYFYRSSDGSERYEMATRDGGIRAITIVSFPTGWQYACFMEQNVCHRSPIGIAGRAVAGGQRPTVRPMPQWRVDTPGLVSTTQRIEGFEVYEYTDIRGVKSLKAPALNFAQLVQDDPEEGKRRALFNIKLEEPPSSLFEPPAGVEIRDMKPPQR